MSNKPTPTRVMTVDDHEIMRGGSDSCSRPSTTWSWSARRGADDEAVRMCPGNQTGCRFDGHEDAWHGWSADDRGH